LYSIFRPLQSDDTLGFVIFLIAAGSLPLQGFYDAFAYGLHPKFFEQVKKLVRRETPTPSSSAKILNDINPGD
jgi:hypothetical protein